MSDDDDKTQDIPEGPKGGFKILLQIFAIGLLGLGGCFEWIVGFREFFEITDKPKNGVHIVRHDNGHKLLEGNYKNGQKVGKHTMWHANGMVKKTTYYEDGEKFVAVG